MIICATPRCGGTIFSQNKARELGICFMGEFHSRHIQEFNPQANIKKLHHETRFQPEYELQNYIDNLSQLTASDKLFLINNEVSFALPQASHYLATRNMLRAFQSMAELLLKAHANDDANLQFTRIANYCKAQLITNILITTYCEHNNRELLQFEDLFSSKNNFPLFQAFSQHNRLKKYFSYLLQQEKQIKRAAN